MGAFTQVQNPKKYRALSSRTAAAVSVQHSKQPSKALFDHIHTLSYSCTTLNQLLCMKEFSLYLQKQRPKIL